METSVSPQAYYLAKMREGLSLKQRSNPHYSLRAYARDIGIHPATLSQIINGKRGLPVKNSEIVIQKLNLGPKERALFLESLRKKRQSYDDLQYMEDENRVVLDESYYKILAEWEHYAVLELFDLEGFERTKEEVSAILDLTPNRTEVVINNLTVAGLVQLDDEGRLVKLQTAVTTADDIANQALRDSHKEALELGLSKLDQYDVDLRDYSSLCMAFDLSQMNAAKALIREFRQKMTALVTEGANRTEVYQIAIQFYPLSTVDKKTH